MPELVRFLYTNEPYPVRIGYKLLLRPLFYLCSILTLVLLLPWDLQIVSIPVFVLFAVAFGSYSGIFKAYYRNRITYWLIILVWIAVSLLLVRPLVHGLAEILFGVRWR